MIKDLEFHLTVLRTLLRLPGRLEVVGAAAPFVKYRVLDHEKLRRPLLMSISFNPVTDDVYVNILDYLFGMDTEALAEMLKHELAHLFFGHIDQVIDGIYKKAYPIQVVYKSCDLVVNGAIQVDMINDAIVELWLSDKEFRIWWYTVSGMKSPPIGTTCENQNMPEGLSVPEYCELYMDRLEEQKCSQGDSDETAILGVDGEGSSSEIYIEEEAFIAESEYGEREEETEEGESEEPEEEGSSGGAGEEEEEEEGDGSGDGEDDSEWDGDTSDYKKGASDDTAGSWDEMKTEVDGKQSSIENSGRVTNMTSDQIKNAAGRAFKQIVGRVEDILKDSYSNLLTKGNLPAEMREYFESLYKQPEVPFDYYIRIFESRNVRIERAKCVHRPARRHIRNADGDTEVWGFGRIRKVGAKVLVVVDTSGSMQKHQLEVVDAETTSMYDRGLEVWIMQVDADIAKEPVLYQGFGSLGEFFGRGGTSFMPAFDWLRKHNDAEQFDYVIYYTDGGAWGDCPETEADLVIPTLWVLVPDSMDKRSFQEQVCPVGDVFKMKDEPISSY